MDGTRYLYYKMLAYILRMHKCVVSMQSVQGKVCTLHTNYELLLKADVTPMQTFPKRQYTCPYCHNWSATYQEIVEDYWPNCELYLVLCPNEYGVKPSCSNMEAHLREYCLVFVTLRNSKHQRQAQYVRCRLCNPCLCCNRLAKASKTGPL
jgi:hypothetical protein